MHLLSLRCQLLTQPSLKNGSFDFAIGSLKSLQSLNICIDSLNQGLVEVLQGIRFFLRLHEIVLLLLDFGLQLQNHHLVLVYLALNLLVPSLRALVLTLLFVVALDLLLYPVVQFLLSPLD